MVQIDGMPIHDIALRTLRKSIGLVTQEPHVFSDTILNNVIFGRGEIGRQSIEEALEAAQLGAEMELFPQGINTRLGEGGVTISGGQRQRLTIARALLSNPPILILDDALSHVDTRTEAVIVQRILEVRQGKTNIIVSHRLSTIQRADIIFVLDSGRVVEQGTHEDLVSAGQEYARLYERQRLSEELAGD
jgi:ATP-binding cassette subfamily B protein